MALFIHFLADFYYNEIIMRIVALVALAVAVAAVAANGIDQSED